MSEIWEWLRSHDTVLWGLGVFSMVTFVGTLALIPVLVARMPADYFLHAHPPPGSWQASHPALRMTILVTKNLLGGLLILGGVAMLVLPGQGILTLLIGVSLLNFPGKRRLELWIISIPAVLRSVNWMRRRAGRAALQTRNGEGSGAREQP